MEIERNSAVVSGSGARSTASVSEIRSQMAECTPPGRWQPGIRFTASGEDDDKRVYPDGGGGGANTSPATMVTTPADLMNDDSLKEVFAARGRHKKGPVVAR